MGRMLTFVARIFADGLNVNSPMVRGVGVDEHTALLLNITSGYTLYYFMTFVLICVILGDIEAVGVSTAYICASDHPAQICTRDVPLTYQGTLSCLS